jgi:hypothetical protein
VSFLFGFMKWEVQRHAMRKGGVGAGGKRPASARRVRGAPALLTIVAARTRPRTMPTDMSEATNVKQAAHGFRRIGVMVESSRRQLLRFLPSRTSPQAVASAFSTIAFFAALSRTIVAPPRPHAPAAGANTCGAASR